MSKTTYKSLLRFGEKEARKHDMEESAIKNLLLHASKMSPTEIYLSMDQEVDKEIENHFKEMLMEYTIKKRPVQYIIGYAYFYGYKILVNDGCLIPRWETEELCNNILIYYSRLFKNQKVKVLDLGTGSGAIAIALKKEEPENMDVTASDVSSDAIEISRKSALLNEVEIDFRVGSWFEPFSSNDKFDIIVSNPPYLTTSEYVEDIVKNNEPDVALYGGDDGLKFYRLILSEIKPFLKDKFIIGFEHGYKSKDALNEIIKANFDDVEIINLKDSADKDRMTIIIKE